MYVLIYKIVPVLLFLTHQLNKRLESTLFLMYVCFSPQSCKPSYLSYFHVTRMRLRDKSIFIFLI